MTLKMRIAALLLVSPGCLISVPIVEADPLEPPTPAEIQYLDQARRVLSRTDDPVAFNGDGELLDQGRYACFRRDVTGLVGFEATTVSPILTQLAFLYLCP